MGCFCQLSLQVSLGTIPPETDVLLPSDHSHVLLPAVQRHMLTERHAGKQFD